MSRRRARRNYFIRVEDDGLLSYKVGPWAEDSRRMQSLGYLRMTLEEMVKVRTYEKRLPLYYLAFYSRHPRGLQFWEEVRRYSTD